MEHRRQRETSPLPHGASNKATHPSLHIGETVLSSREKGGKRILKIVGNIESNSQHSNKITNSGGQSCTRSGNGQPPRTSSECNNLGNMSIGGESKCSIEHCNGNTCKRRDCGHSRIRKGDTSHARNKDINNNNKLRLHRNSALARSGIGSWVRSEPTIAARIAGCLPTSSRWALETPLNLARRRSCKKPSGGHGGGCSTLGDRIVAAATGVFENEL